MVGLCRLSLWLYGFGRLVWCGLVWFGFCLGVVVLLVLFCFIRVGCVGWVGLF